MKKDLTGQVAVVTGANGGIGFAIVKHLANLGVKIIALVRKDVDSMQKRLDELSPGHVAMIADVTNSAQLDNVAMSLTQCDILINCAGKSATIARKNLNSLTDDMFDEIFRVNTRGTFATVRSFQPLLSQSKNGLIINISSMAAYHTHSRNIAYSASKAAVESLTKNLARSLAPVRIVSICPGVIKTGFSNAPESVYNELALQTPLQRICTVEDVAQTVEALATSMPFVTGSSILLDGGALV